VRFNLINDKFSEEYGENWWTYTIEFEFIFNKLIDQITVTDHPWRKKGHEKTAINFGVATTKMNGETLLETMEND